MRRRPIRELTRLSGPATPEVHHAARAIAARTGGVARVDDELDVVRKRRLAFRR